MAGVKCERDEMNSNTGKIRKREGENRNMTPGEDKCTTKPSTDGRRDEGQTDENKNCCEMSAGRGQIEGDYDIMMMEGWLMAWRKTG